MAYQGIYGHYLGPQHVDNMATMAEDKLKNTVYHGEQRRWEFTKKNTLTCTTSSSTTQCWKA